MGTLRAISILLLCTTGLSAQQYPLAYPQDSTQTSQAHVLPFGYNATRSFDESRFQQLIPARYLPSAGATISALEVVGAVGDATILYDRLRIVISHARLEALDSGFDANLPTPVTVVERTDATLELTRDAWSRVTFDAPFVYDGSSDLVVEIRKSIDPDAPRDAIVGTRVGGNPGRPDLPAPHYAYGAHGSGAFDAVKSTHRVFTASALRLVVDRPALRVRSDRPATGGNVSALGSILHVDLSAPATSLYATLISRGFGAPMPTEPLATGTAWVPLAYAWTLDAGQMPPWTDARTVDIMIPDDPGLVGFHAVFQTLVLLPDSPLPLWTNATDAIVHD